MKVCLLSRRTPPEFSGAGIRTVNQAKELVAHGHKISLMTATSNSRRVPGIAVEPVELPSWFYGDESVSEPFRVPYIPVLIAKFVRAFVATRPDVVHAIGVGSWFSLAGLFAAQLLRIPTVAEVTLVGGDDPVTLANTRLGALKAPLLRAASATVCISPALVERCLQAGLPESKIKLISNPVDTQKFAPVPEQEKLELTEEMEVPRATHVFLTVGAVTHRKGSLEIAKAFAEFFEHTGEGYLIFVGPLYDDEYVSHVRRFLRARGLNRHVEFAGRSERVHSWMKVADTFLFASRNEGLGTVVVEAMASGLPVVSRRLAGITDYLLGDDEYGLTVGTIEGMVEAMTQIHNGRELRERITRAARIRAVELFSSSYICESYERLYSDLVKPNKSRI
jgi:glycosyltransferase involved in cell wall biosynthesis